MVCIDKASIIERSSLYWIRFEDGWLGPFTSLARGLARVGLSFPGMKRYEILENHAYFQDCADVGYYGIYKIIDGILVRISNHKDG